MFKLQIVLVSVFVSFCVLRIAAGGDLGNNFFKYIQHDHGISHLKSLGIIPYSLGCLQWGYKQTVHPEFSVTIKCMRYAEEHVGVCPTYQNCRWYQKFYFPPPSCNYDHDCSPKCKCCYSPCYNYYMCRPAISTGLGTTTNKPEKEVDSSAETTTTTIVPEQPATVEEESEEEKTTVGEDETTVKEEETTVKEEETTAKVKETTVKEKETTAKEETSGEELTTVEEEITSEEETSAEETTAKETTVKKTTVKKETTTEPTTIKITTTTVEPTTTTTTTTTTRGTESPNGEWDNPEGSGDINSGSGSGSGDGDGDGDDNWDDEELPPAQRRRKENRPTEYYEDIYEYNKIP